MSTSLVEFAGGMYMCDTVCVCVCVCVCGVCVCVCDSVHKEIIPLFVYRQLPIVKAAIVVN